MTLPDALQVVGSILPECLIAGAVILIAVALGWLEARRPDRWTVQGVAWWLDAVVRPLLASRSWAWRAAVIALNNSLVCGLVIGLGSWPAGGWIAVATVGFALGVGVRLLTGGLAGDTSESGRVSPRKRWAGRAGFALNMLEPPAILVAAGLSLSQGALSATVAPGDAWAVFAWVVLPALVLAAAGEALWMGVYPVAATAPPAPGQDLDHDDAGTGPGL